jgi:DNA invertase Pin-like site-specific DNA recombinase
VTKGDRVIGYVRVSTAEQGESGNGLESQRDAIERECRHRGWQLLRIEEDVQSGKSTKNRPGLNRALSACRRGEADGIVAAKIDRLSRSVIDFAGLLEDARKRGYNVVALDLGVDLSSVQGELIANVLAAVAQWERQMIGERTKAGMAVVKKRGTKSGRPIGRPAHRFDDSLRGKVLKARRAGESWSEIARELEQDGVRTATGNAHWHPRQAQRLAAGR